MAPPVLSDWPGGQPGNQAPRWTVRAIVADPAGAYAYIRELQDQRNAARRLRDKAEKAAKLLRRSMRLHLDESYRPAWDVPTITGGTVLTLQRKRELRQELTGIEGNGGAEGRLAGILRELLEHMPPGGHAEAVEELRRPTLDTDSEAKGRG